MVPITVESWLFRFKSTEISTVVLHWIKAQRASISTVLLLVIHDKDWFTRIHIRALWFVQPHMGLYHSQSPRLHVCGTSYSVNCPFDVLLMRMSFRSDFQRVQLKNPLFGPQHYSNHRSMEFGVRKHRDHTAQPPILLSHIS